MRLRLSLVLAAALLASCGKSGAPSADPAASSASAAQATRLLLSPEDILTLHTSLLANGPVITGSVEPERRADLRAEVGAVVLQVLKENGEPVKAGDLLVRLDDASIRDSLASAEESQRAASQAFDQTERQVQRLITLRQQGMTSQQSLDDAQVQRNNAQSELLAAKARVAAARQQLQRTLVRAPFAGVVSERQVSAGDTAQIGKALVKVIDPGSMRFEGLVSADRIHELKTGQNVSFRVNGYPGVDFAGRLRRIDASANAATRQVALIVDFIDPAAAPRVAGLFAEGRVETGSTQSLMLPEGALVRSGDAAYTWVLGQGKLAKVGVTLGARDPRSGDVPVTSGLRAGDRVLRSPTASLVDGQGFDASAPGGSPAASAPDPLKSTRAALAAR
jgi:RND family efflux transporter MFP subunit